MRAYSCRAEARNPLLALPEVREAFAALPADCQAALRTVLNAMSKDFRARKNEPGARQAAHGGVLEGQRHTCAALGACHPPEWRHRHVKSPVIVPSPKTLVRTSRQTGSATAEQVSI